MDTSPSVILNSHRIDRRREIALKVGILKVERCGFLYYTPDGSRLARAPLTRGYYLACPKLLR